jgi:tRNA-dihydrouridine synthase B
MTYNAPMKIGPYHLPNQLILAPMAGVTDRTFRSLCIRMGAGMAVSEMVSSNKQLWHTRKTRLRLDHAGEQLPRSVQIAGTDPLQMADAAKFNVDQGAQIIDINMGCPAKKVCNVMAGSALMKDESLVGEILDAVVNAVDVPVTLKTRTGWDPENKNAVSIARIAESSGIQALAVHGRTRACAYKGEAEYETIKRVKAAVNIPVIANGDIDSPYKAAQVLKQTGADGIMVGRAAQGNPWIFREIRHLLETGEVLAPPSLDEVRNVLINHLENLYDFYGSFMGVRIARKHIGWYCKHHPDTGLFKQRINQLESTQEQLDLVTEFFSKTTGGLLAA